MTGPSPRPRQVLVVPRTGPLLTAAGSERERLEAQKKELEGFRSELLERLRTVIEGKEGVRIGRDRFVIASEVLFPIAKAEPSDDGKEQITSVSNLILNLADEFPAGIDWALRVDGHTDDRLIVGQRDYADNWELSQARPPSVVRFLTSELNFPENRSAEAGFGEHRPVNPGGNQAARPMPHAESTLKPNTIVPSPS